MGQENAVKVVRFRVRDSIEEQLFEEIDLAAAKLVTRSNDNTYMCEDAHKSLDKNILQQKKLEDEEVFVGESMSAKQQLSRRMAEARAKNEIIVIDDSDDDETENCDNKIEFVRNSMVSAAQVKVKPEPASAKRGNAEVGEIDISAKKQKLKCDLDDCNTTIDTCQQPLAQEKAPQIMKDNNCSSMEDAVTNMTCGNNVVEPRSSDADRSDVTLQQEWAKEEEEFARAIGKGSLNQFDVCWLKKFRDLKQIKEKSGLAWVRNQRSTLGKWCQRQRNENSKRLKGQKNSMSDGRLAYLNDVGFPWSKAEETTPQKRTSDTQDETRMVSPIDDLGIVGETRAVVCKMKKSDNEKGLVEETEKEQAARDNPDVNINQHLSDLNSTGRATSKVHTNTLNDENVEKLVSPTADNADRLKSLLVKCEIGEHFVKKFQEAGILSAPQLQDKLEDVVFMENLVSIAGLTAAEAIRLQIRAQK